jgi:carboxypeptidase D
MEAGGCESPRSHLDITYMLSRCRPVQAFIFLREFVLGSNQTGLVLDPSKPAIGGEDPSIASADLMPGTTAIFYGSGTTVSSALVPSASIASWQSAVVEATVTNIAPTSVSTASTTFAL